MTRTRLAGLVLLPVVLGTSLAQDEPAVAPAPRAAVVLPPGYKSPKDAVRANPKEFNFTASTLTTASGYLGVVVADQKGKAVIDAVEPGSPADRAGLQEGDVVTKVGGQAATTGSAVRDHLRGRLAGDKVAFEVDRGGTAVSVSATLDATTRPMNTAAAASGRAVMGVTLGGAPTGGGVRILDVTAKGPADQAGIKAGDVVLKMDGLAVEGDDGFRHVLANKKGGDRVDLLVLRDKKEIEMKATVATETPDPKVGRGPAGGGWDDRIPRAWLKPSYNLAILGVEYPDVKHNPKIKDADWEASMFSTGQYTGKSATGDKVYGSMNDYFKEQSYGTFKVKGKFVGWVEVSKKRADYWAGSGLGNKEKTAYFTEALDKFTAKHGKDALKEYDGIFFLYAGGRVRTTRDGLYWPHRANVGYGGKTWPYFIVQEGGDQMNDISVFCHEFGHMLGLPDLYARPEQPGSEGVGVWCAMSNQVGGGRPQHFSAWCKEQLGWLKPTVIDPRVKQKLVLAPVEDDPTQCFKIMVRADGSEYFLLENRSKKKGWDASLPADGLLVWRVVNNRPILEESHGVEGAAGPRSFPEMVPFPSRANAAFTPYTTPSSKSQLGGGLPVYVTNIKRYPDGRITFHVGYEYQ